MWWPGAQLSVNANSVFSEEYDEERVKDQLKESIGAKALSRLSRAVPLKTTSRAVVMDIYVSDIPKAG